MTDYNTLTQREKLFINSIEALITQGKLTDGEVVLSLAFLINKYKKLKGGRE